MIIFAQTTTMAFIILIIITSLFINGLHHATYYETELMERDPDNSNILWFVRYYSEQWFPSFIHRPLIGCVQCMGSIWGGLIYFWTYPTITIESCATCVVFVCAVSAMNMIVNKLIES